NVLVADVAPADRTGLEEGPEVEEEMIAQYNVGAPPITSDPPIHTWARKLLLPPFSVTSIAKWEPETRELCASLIDGFIDKARARHVLPDPRRGHRHHVELHWFGDLAPCPAS